VNLRYIPVICLILLYALAGCVSTRNLKDGQYILTGQYIRGNLSVNTAELSALYLQNANTKITGVTPGLFFYQVADRFYDSVQVANKLEESRIYYDSLIAEEHKNSSCNQRLVRLENKKERRITTLQTRLEKGNWTMRNLGQKPVYYDSALTVKTVEQLHLYYKRQGFFNNKVSYTLQPRPNRKHISIIYHVKENFPHKLNNLEYVSTDSNIRSLVNKSSVYLQTGQRFKEEDLVGEKDRIYKLLRNNGYFNFGKDYISFLGDSTITDSIHGHKLVNIKTIISNPTHGRHKAYTFESINFVLDASPVKNAGNPLLSVTRDTIPHNSVNFYANSRKHPFLLLGRKLRFKVGDLYTDRAVSDTRSLLAAMDMFSFVNLSFDTSATGAITAWVLTNRLPRFQTSEEFGVIVGQGSPGPYINMAFKMRNLLGGYEHLELSARYSDEGQLNLNKASEEVFMYRAKELGLSASLLFQEFLMPARFQEPFVRYHPKSRLALGYTSINRPEYTRSIGRTSLSYLMQLNAKSTLNISPIDISYINTLRLDSAHRDFLELLQKKGNSLIHSFDTSLVSSLSAFYVYHTNATGKSRATYFKIAAEAGGLTPYLLNRLTNEPIGKLGRLSYFQFIRTDIDWRIYRPLTRKSTVATRVHGGLGRYLGDSNTLPYEKFFFIGGGNSIRAWPARRLGPGAYVAKDAASERIIRDVEQPGEILLEVNSEWRHKIAGFLEGAIFLDAGNIWTFSRDKDLGAGREFSDFRFNRFYKEIAIGTGAGLRLDLSFLILRFDMGIKVYDPVWTYTRDRFRLNKLDLYVRKPSDSDLVFSMGIGYPF
jgi:outer membrane protein insertion porin family